MAHHERVKVVVPVCQTGTIEHCVVDRATDGLHRGSGGRFDRSSRIGVQLVIWNRTMWRSNGTNDVDGRWIIEGQGVEPDIVVENDPKSVIAGRDPQLERAVEELVKKMDAEPMKLPKRPADPVKTK